LNKKIYIIGPVASGKSTLARKLSKEMNIPYYELDNVVHERNPHGDRRRTPEEIEHIFSKIINSDNWIIEGVYRDCFYEGFERCEKILLFETGSVRRKIRIFKRWVFQNLGMEKCSYKPTLGMLTSMYRWSRDYGEKRKRIDSILEPYIDKIMFIK